MAEKKKKTPADDMKGAISQAEQTVKKVVDPFSRVMGAMDRAGRWLFGSPLPYDPVKEKRLKQAGK